MVLYYCSKVNNYCMVALKANTLHWLARGTLRSSSGVAEAGAPCAVAFRQVIHVHHLYALHFHLYGYVTSSASSSKISFNYIMSASHLSSPIWLDCSGESGLRFMLSLVFNSFNGNHISIANLNIKAEPSTENNPYPWLPVLLLTPLRTRWTASCLRQLHQTEALLWTATTWPQLLARAWAQMR